MTKSTLKLEPIAESESVFRTIFRNSHGRTIYLSLERNNSQFVITECFYVDRNQGKSGNLRYAAKPRLLKTRSFPVDELLDVIANELDKRFYGVEFVSNDTSDLSLDDYIEAWSDNPNKQYRFLIMLGDGEPINGLPPRLRTRLKNKLHRSIYIELEYYKDGKGVVKDCYYYDRKYMRKGVKITPPMLLKCFFSYSEKGIIELINNELCCDFTHIIVTDNIDLDENPAPVCGSVFRR